MEFKSILILWNLISFADFLIQHSACLASDFPPGNRLLWTFEKNGQSYEVQDKLQAVSSTSAIFSETPTQSQIRSDQNQNEFRFNFISASPNTSSIFHIVSYPNASSFATIVNSMLVAANLSPKGAVNSLMTTFKAVQVSNAESENKGLFHLLVVGVNADDDEPLPLVTPNSHSPFTFFTQDRYPLESPAVFSVEKLPLNDYLELIYNGTDQGQMMVATWTIHKSNHLEVDKERAYDHLLSLVHSYGHLQGHEIFFLALHIYMDLGDSSAVFERLPRTIQLVIRSTKPTKDEGDSDLEPLGLKLSYLHQNKTLYPMKYNYATDPESAENILPYRFNFQLKYDWQQPPSHIGIFDGPKWDIIYAERHQLYACSRYPTVEEELFERIFTGNTFEFWMFWCPLSNAIQMWAGNATCGMPTVNALGPNQHSQGPDFYFRRIPTSGRCGTETMLLRVEEFQ